METIQIVGIKNILQYINRMYLVYFPLMTYSEKQQYVDFYCCRLYDQ